MAFRFSLEAVLRLRTSYERLEKLRLLAIGAMIVRLQEEISAAASADAQARGARREMLLRGATSVELQFDAARAAVRADIKNGFLQKLAALQKQKVRQATAYQAARRKRELLEALRDRRLREYQREQARRQQQVLDELYLLRRPIFE